MNKRRMWTAVVTALLAGSATLAKDVKSPAPGVKFPKGYRQWVHTEAMVIFSDKHPLFHIFGGMHHIYMNENALRAAKTHGPYADGSVIVFDLLEANEIDGAYSDGERKLVAVMQKDSKQFKETGGWGFEGFKAGQPEQRLVTDTTAQCFNCHASQKDHDFVYSQYRE